MLDFVTSIQFYLLQAHSKTLSIQQCKRITFFNFFLEKILPFLKFSCQIGGEKQFSNFTIFYLQRFYAMLLLI